jgi:hypothetical protein
MSKDNEAEPQSWEDEDLQDIKRLEKSMGDLFRLLERGRSMKNLQNTGRLTFHKFCGLSI